MSLVSVRHFVAPFKSKVNLFTIIFAALAVLLFRFQGGAIGVIDRGNVSSHRKSTFVPVKKNLPDFGLKDLESFSPGADLKSINREPISKKTVQQETIQLSPEEREKTEQEWAQRKKAAASGKIKKKKGGLDEIAASLGL